MKPDTPRPSVKVVMCWWRAVSVPLTGTLLAHTSSPLLPLVQLPSAASRMSVR